MSHLPSSAAFIAQRDKQNKQKQQTLKANLNLLNQSQVKSASFCFNAEL